MTQQLVRFQFGGHATFPVRYGWLPKGLERAASASGFTRALDTADDLGLGSKMVESLAYWLDVMGLATADQGILYANDVGELIAKHDAYFERPGTWWFLHLLLAQRRDTVWGWFFNDYNERIFDRLGVADAFLRHTRSHAQRPASPSMVQRDIACLLSAYASRAGVDVMDPDEIGACPLRELGLLIRQDAVNRYERARRPHSVPQEVFLAAAAMLAKQTGNSDFTLRELATLPGSPGRVLCVGVDAIEMLVGKIGRPGSRRHQEGIQVETLAGERRLSIPSHPPAHWLAQLYRRLGEEGAA
jgi:hypothetical protein